ncbi:twin-arginine translocase subunit TatC [Thermosulfurimonas dismutans]|uniref:Sec-independent protein translocase protein TatC n=1 Tax=Thermosulfurimonas dismutans TaxID=999894 RepID=A0A179D404_9BACT|nr:twin-arginine translocase subunit TatC [Thermosulfurimonas dismutans]OAQ20713.1 Twin-arginine translocation protein TatC [Thermosulfurimonas dismutans]
MREEAPVKSFARVILSLRRRILRVLILLCLTSLGFLMVAPRILLYLQKRLGQNLAFYGVAEPWLAVIKVAAISAIIFVFPYILWLLWKALSGAFGLSRKLGLLFILVGMFLFYGGLAFCFFVTLPYGMKFLLSFQRDEIVPTISVGHFVNFVGLFLLAFGLIFELPLFMILAARIGLLDPYKAGKYRRHAILVIAILAAVLTPTPDVFNMALMAGPLYLLFELGLLGGKLVVKKNA